MQRLTILWLLCAILTASPALGRSGPPGRAQAEKPEAGTYVKATGVLSAGGSPLSTRRGRLLQTAAGPRASLKVAAKQLRTRSGFTWRQRRALGLTLPNMIRKLRELDKAGELRGLSRKEVAEKLVGQLRADNPRAFASQAAIDPEFWIRLYELVKFLLPFLLLLI